MKYIIMADGKGKRWNNFQNIPKHFVEIDGEKIIERTIRLLRKYDKKALIIITSHDKRYEFEGAERYEPLNNNIEIDRFTYELIEPDVCFIYGDTYYTEESIKTITETKAEDLLFFGNSEKIVAVKIKDSKKMKKNIDNVKELFLSGKIKQCIGWQLYQSFTGLPFGKKQIGEKYVVVDNLTKDFNKPMDYIKFKERRCDI